MRIGILFAAALALWATTASAHFLLIYTPEVNLEKRATVPMRMVFWHPFENGEVMELAKPEEFYVMRAGKRTDLMSALKPIQFTGLENAASAYAADVELKRVGDYIFVMKPAPYFEASEDKYIQQITKSYVNRGGIPGPWAEPLGLAAEIVPLVKPTNVIVGSSFTGRVLAGGNPVAGAEIEIEFMAAEPDLATNSPKKATASPMPGGAVVVMSDENGYITFGIPRAGFWGFAALEVGTQTEHDGKPLSQDGVLWIRAYDMQ